jgi:calcineurin-like phosphoesterase family protein
MRINKQNLFFASDFHLGHNAVIQFDKRPYKNTDEMHQAIIDNWNSVVGEEDTAFYLGDLFYKCRWELAKEIVDQMNGKMYHIMGNHDRYQDIKRIGRFEKIYGDDTALGGATINVEDVDANRGWQTIVMCHYMIFQWNKAHYSAWHLHGHSHQSIAKNEEFNWLYDRKVLDVGINGWDYRPLSYQQIKDIFTTKQIKSVDHHVER